VGLLGHPDPDWGPPLLAAGLTTLGGLLPDLDSDSGVPVRELFGVSAAVGAAALYPLLRHHALPLEQALVLVAAAYLFIRYGVSRIFRHWTVHRGMFHSLPAMLIAGELTYLAYRGPDPMVRLYLAGGVMLGFFSHLVLDEFYSVDFNGARLRFNKFAGSAVKLFSPSWTGTLVCYLLLAVLSFAVWEGQPDWLRWPDAWPRPSWLSGATAGEAP
jgi:hypothetical protein